jgi:hypothetical protein
VHRRLFDQRSLRQTLILKISSNSKFNQLPPGCPQMLQVQIKFVMEVSCSSHVQKPFFTYPLCEHGGGGGGGRSSDQQRNKRCKGRWLPRSIRHEDQRSPPFLFLYDPLVSRRSVAGNPIGPIILHPPLSLLHMNHLHSVVRVTHDYLRG